MLRVSTMRFYVFDGGLRGEKTIFHSSCVARWADSSDNFPHMREYRP